LASERIGILGGTFDPVHIAHLVAANEVRHALALDRMLLVVAGDPWQKRETVVAPAALRFEMVQAAIDEVPGVEASRIELDRAGATYSIDTVDALQHEDPARTIVLVVGADVAVKLDSWHRADELRERVTLAVVTREGSDPIALDGWRVEHVPIPRLDVSSTDLRARVASGRPIDVLVPAGAVRVLRAHGLYTRP
jgi:nicotinate-nucleotide adenylyltransferase